jgi:CO/xanthine dehydrogenase FAD-binding subunit
MIPATFEYHAPTSIKEATALLARLGTTPGPSGGQSLIPLMKLRSQARNISSISTAALTRSSNRGVLRIGGLCRESDSRLELIRTRYP